MSSDGRAHRKARKFHAQFPAARNDYAHYVQLLSSRLMTMFLHERTTKSGTRLVRCLMRILDWSCWPIKTLACWKSEPRAMH
jgi:hypothetical protein